MLSVAETSLTVAVVSARLIATSSLRFRAKRSTLWTMQ
jgi:hypothetical protein